MNRGIDVTQIDNEAIYSKWDKWVDMKAYGPRRRWLRHTIIDCVDHIANPVESILDMGCGEDTNTKLLYDRFQCEEIGCDLSSSGIECCIKKYGAHRDMTFVTNEKVAHDASFDLVTCFEVLEHIED